MVLLVHVSSSGCIEKLRLTPSCCPSLRRPLWLKTVWVVVVCAGCAAITGATFRLLEGDDGKVYPNIPTTRMVPQSSYIWDWADGYDKYFSGVPLPVDFPLQNVAWGNPRNGPALEAAATRLQASPLLNSTTFRNWYSAFREFCSSADTCRGSLQDVDGNPDVAGFPTNQSISFLNVIEFITKPEYKVFAADFKLPTLGSYIKTAKFGAETVQYGVATYSDQLQLPFAMNSLSAQVNSILNGADSTGTARTYGFSSALPYMEMWRPARDDLYV